MPKFRIPPIVAGIIIIGPWIPVYQLYTQSREARAFNKKWEEDRDRFRNAFKL
jgi:hypothetical protein